MFCCCKKSKEDITCNDGSMDLSRSGRINNSTHNTKLDELMKSCLPLDEKIELKNNDELIYKKYMKDT